MKKILFCPAALLFILVATVVNLQAMPWLERAILPNAAAVLRMGDLQTGSLLHTLLFDVNHLNLLSNYPEAKAIPGSQELLAKGEYVFSIASTGATKFSPDELDDDLLKQEFCIAGEMAADMRALILMLLKSKDLLEDYTVKAMTIEGCQSFEITSKEDPALVLILAISANGKGWMLAPSAILRQQLKAKVAPVNQCLTAYRAMNKKNVISLFLGESEFVNTILGEDILPPEQSKMLEKLKGLNLDIASDTEWIHLQLILHQSTPEAAKLLNEVLIVPTLTSFKSIGPMFAGAERLDLFDKLTSKLDKQKVIVSTSISAADVKKLMPLVKMLGGEE